MASVLQHRGPDDAGDWADSSGRVAFGFRRLAILDLSEAGHQPMVSPSGRFTMVFNGEIYNFRELRRSLAEEGVSFRGHSDSEVILAAFDSWGVDSAIERIEGMFAIALWDAEQDHLILIRDRLGIKPLYVAEIPGGIAFASEIGPLLTLDELDRSLDPSMVRAYVQYWYVPAPRTPFRSVSKLPPGHLLRVPAGSAADPLPAPEPYWSVGSTGSTGAPSERRSLDGAVDELEDLLSQAVRSHMVADVPIGALFSGGIDSTLVVALMRRHASGPVRTFTIGFDRPEHDESDAARELARHLETDHHELTVSDQDALEVVPHLPDIFDEPMANPSAIPTYIVSKLARESVTVALAGDGGDELFGGYNRYLAGYPLIRMFSRIPHGPRRLVGSSLLSVPSGLWDFVSRFVGSGNGGVRLLDQKVTKTGRMLRARTDADMYRTLLSTSDEAGRFVKGGGGSDPLSAALATMTGGITLSALQQLDQRFYLPDDLLMKVDRASMATSLEVRVPLLDRRVVEFSRSLPDEFKIHGGTSKRILRELLFREVPRELVDRPKTGFTVPVADWLRGALREWARHHLFGAEARRNGSMFDRKAVGESWDALLSGQDEVASGLWAMIVFEAWRAHWGIEVPH